MGFDFERLDVYHKALAFVDEVYAMTRLFPSFERYGLTDQFRRAAISIALNIAEGSGRTKRDFKNFLRNARSSCSECVAVAHVAAQQQYLPAASESRCTRQLTDISKMLSGLIRSLDRSSQRTMNTEQ